MEKLIMLKNGALKKPIDIFDLFYHSAPLILLIIKFIRDYSNRWRSKIQNEMRNIFAFEPISRQYSTNKKIHLIQFIKQDTNF